MKKWSINNVSSGMESDVRLTQQDVIDAFLSENGVFPGSPLIEFIDMNRLRKSLLSERDADVPRAVQPSAYVRTATAEPIASYDFRQTPLGEDGSATFFVKITTPKFTAGNKAESDMIEIKMRDILTRLNDQMAERVCDLYRTPRTIQTKALAKQAFTIGLQQLNNYVIVPLTQNQKALDIGALELIEPNRDYFFKIVFSPNSDHTGKFGLRFTQLRVGKAQAAAINAQINQIANPPQPNAPAPGAVPTGGAPYVPPG